MSKPVIALVGADAFLQTEQLRAIVKILPGDAQRMDFDGESASLSQVLDELRSFSMFGSTKLVVVREADAFITRFREELEDYVAAPSDSGTLVLRVSSLPSNQRIYKSIMKTGEIVKCEPPKQNDLAGWIATRGKAHGVTVPLDAAAVLADRIGPDLGKLDNEIAKLALMSDGGKIDAKAIAGNVAFQREQEMYQMTNALAAGRTTDALVRWRQLMQTDPSTEFRAVVWLTMWLENVKKALAMKAKGVPINTIAQQLRIWPKDLVDPFFKTAATLGDRGASAAVSRLADLDRRSKSGLGAAAELVELFILSFAKK